MKTIMGVVSLVLFIIGCCLFVKVMDDASKTNEGIDARMKVHVGKAVAMHKDTLMIVDYSMIMNMYKLENGTWVNPELIDKIEIK